MHWPSAFEFHSSVQALLVPCLGWVAGTCSKLRDSLTALNRHYATTSIYVIQAPSGIRTHRLKAQQTSECLTGPAAGATLMSCN